jgi:hypothetical protein
MVVFENYMYEFIGKKYLKIVKEEPSEKNNKIFTDNNDNIYAYYWNKYDDEEDYIEVEDEVNRITYYISNKDRKKNPYLYKDEKGKNRIILQDHMNCLEKILTTEKSKEYYNLLYKSHEEWVSQIRRIMLNMNAEPFEGHKGGKKRIMKKNTKKNKRTVKNRKNKGTKRIYSFHKL